jgi:hypothetical protein
MRERRAETCDCGHGPGLHDRHGCAAYLGAFPETAEQHRYCRCRRPSGERVTVADRRFLVVVREQREAAEVPVEALA